MFQALIFNLCILFQSYIEDKRNDGIDTIVFLYKLVPGICPKSFGFNVAELAGIPEDVVKFGTTVAFQMEARHNLRQLFIHKFASLVKSGEKVDVEELQKALESVESFESQTKKDLEDLPGGVAGAGTEWWPSPSNDPCSASPPCEETVPPVA